MQEEMQPYFDCESQEGIFSIIQACVGQRGYFELAKTSLEVGMMDPDTLRRKINAINSAHAVPQHVLDVLLQPYLSDQLEELYRLSVLPSRSKL